MGCCFGRSRLVEGQPLVASLSNSISQHLVDPPIVVTPRRRRERDPTQFYLDPRNCIINWRQPDTTVGVVTVAEIRLVCRNRSPYHFKPTDYFQVDVVNDETGREVNCIIEPSNIINASTIRVSFTIQIPGTYRASFLINGNILDRIHTREYQPGEPDPSKTVFHLHAVTLVFKCNTFFPILFSPKDTYGNTACINCDLLSFETRKNGHSSDILLPECLIHPVDNVEGQYEMLVKLDEPGYYNCCVKYIDRVLGLNDTTVICLTEENISVMERNLASLFLTYGHQAHLIPANSTKDTRKVKIFISPRLLQIREYTLFISSRLFTCRVCNSTQFTLHSQPQKFTIDDGLQPPVTLTSPIRDTIAAVFYKFVQKNIGGTVSFKDKVTYFHQELRKRNPDHGNRRDVRLTVRRFNLLESTMQATRGYSVDMWKRQFNITFEGEPGIDIGGVCREFFNCLCDVLFGGRNPRGLFTPFKDDPQSLVHPNSSKKRDRLLTLEYYQFAGRVVGKCLYDTAIGNRLLVKAKLTRSFLAQIIGLRISWKHFETDDPDLYRHKVTHIRDSDIVELDLDLTFAEEEFSSSGASDPRVVSLTPGGSKTKVTDGNKMDYLNQLAQYKLGKCVAEEVKYFLKGLHELIPDDLLSMFDENELELLMCGVQKLSVDDLRAHAQVRNSSSEFERVLNWFWATVEEFNQEQLARLVQFVTGSSQIPTGGFSELRPPFILAPSGENGNRLPYAHTCFNHLCLPLSDTYEQFRTALMTAINEGCEGVLLA